MTPAAVPRPAIERQRVLVQDGTRRLVGAVTMLGEPEWTEPSLLPGWSRAHVVAHLARNGDALVNLATWARTGVRSPMYPNLSIRAEDIERSADNQPDLIRVDFEESVGRLDAALAGMLPQAWEHRVETAMGRDVAATEILWLRIREVWIHSHDLDVGLSLSDAPPELLVSLLAEAAAMLSTREGCPSLVLRAVSDDRLGTDRTWLVGPTSSLPETVSGSLFDLLIWVLGRSNGQGLQWSQPGDLPGLPTWL